MSGEISHSPIYLAPVSTVKWKHRYVYTYTYIYLSLLFFSLSWLLALVKDNKFRVLD